MATSANSPIPGHVRQPTVWARKYGLPAVNAAFQPPNDTQMLQSFFTPVDPAAPNLTHTVAEHQLAEQYQNTFLRGFTTFELQSVDAFTERQLMPGNLNTPIHRCFGRAKWSAVAKDRYSLIKANGVRSGIWDMKNDLAWNALLPSLRLASMILSQIHKHPFDAFVLGRINPVNPNRISPMAIDFGLPDTSPQCSFQLRAPHSNNEAQCKEMVDTLENSPLLQNMTLGFVSLHKKADGTLLTKGVAHATTEIKYAPPSVKLWLAYEKPALLLRDDLNDGERLALQTAVANTLVHERMHAYSFAKNHRDWQLQTGRDEKPPLGELYFEDEPVAEAGCSMENALWGGCLREIGLAPSGLTFGLGLQSWPDPGVSTRTALLEPPIPTFKTLLPLAVPYFESLHQSDFWSNMVRSFHSFRPRPIYVTEHNQTRILLSVKRRNVQGPWERLAVPPQSPFLAEPSNAARTIRETLSYMPDQRANNYRFNIALNQFRTMLQIRDEKAALILDQFELIARIDILQGGYNTYESLLKITGWIEELCRINETTFVPIKQVDRASTQFGVASREILNFNRGLRMILDEISGAGFQEIDRQINALKTIIDSIRTYFTQSSQHPLGISAAEDSNIAAQEEANHQTALANTKTRTSTDDLEASRVICTRVTGSVTSTLLTKCEARIILGANDSVDLDTRIMQLTRVVETLQAMLSPPGRAQEQQQYLDSAQLQLVALNQQKQQGQPPGGTTFIS